jgi:hypothetical protein
MTLRVASWFTIGSLIIMTDVCAGENNVRLAGKVVDSDTGKPLPARIYIRGEDGTWYFPKSADKNGSAVEYRKTRGESIEMHTTLSAHPFTIHLPAGTYTITVERGKEYHPATRTVIVKEGTQNLTVELNRWIDMASRGWYSGDTHVHRTMEELPNVMLAEDLNVTFPLLHWVTAAFAAPSASDKSAKTTVEPKAVPVDSTRVIYPQNTEYEIFTVNGKQHVLGAVFILNHKSVFDKGVPPVKPVAEQARREGALLELDKHNWSWSMMLVPVMNVDLFELSNNHVWRTVFGFTEFGVPAPEYMQIEKDDRGWTEWGWIDYGFKNYYALLDYGFRLRPTAGTASGVHPVPLGFGRVYVHLNDGFSYDAWMRGLNEGRSFVTTGPMLFVEVNGEEPGQTFTQATADPQQYRIRGSALSGNPLDRIEIVINGEVARTIRPANNMTSQCAYDSPIDEQVRVETSSWIAVRCVEKTPEKRVRFAHSSPVHIDVPGKRLRPRKEEVEFLISRIKDEIARNTRVLPEPALDEYRQALRIYGEIANTAR